MQNPQDFYGSRSPRSSRVGFCLFKRYYFTGGDNRSQNIYPNLQIGVSRDLTMPNTDGEAPVAYLKLLIYDYEDAYWEGGNSRGYRDLVRPAIPLFPPTALVNSGYKYITGGGIDGTKADAWDYALGWLDLIPEGVEIKLAAKYTLTAAFKAIVIKQAVKKLPVAVPSFKKVSFDWVHIFDNHSDWGKTAQQSGIKDIFEGLDEKQIKEVVTGAYQNIIWHAKSAAQKGVYQMRGKYKSWTVEFWVNTTTKTVETAYPLGRKP